MKKETHEYVEAVPGPPIVISRETYEKMQKNNNAKENEERLKKCRKFFKNIKNKTNTTERDEFTL